MTRELLQQALDALERIINTVPAVDANGSFFVEYHDDAGEYLGYELINPMHVAAEMGGIAIRERKLLRTALAIPEQPAYSWECNECGAQEYTMAVSEADVHRLACGRCGSDEWHKEKTR